MLLRAESSGRAAFAFGTFVCALLLVGLGGLVTSKGAGMAVPDWPTTYGYNMFFFPISLWQGGIFYEHTHRLFASFVGLLTVVLAVWLFGAKARAFLRWGGFTLIALGVAAAFVLPVKPQTPYLIGATGLAASAASRFWPSGKPASVALRGLGLSALGAVVVQGVLGGLRVVLYRNEIGILHGALAQAFLVMLAFVALLSSRWWPRIAQAVRGRSVGSLRCLALTGSVLVFAQLLLGAAMRHQHAGLAVPDFPLAYGRLWPPMDPGFLDLVNRSRLEVQDYNPITALHVGVHMAHRVGAVAILATVGLLVWRVRAGGAAGSLLERLGWLWLGLVLFQVGLGAATVWTNKAADIATLHVLVGALNLVAGSIITLACFKSWVESETSLVHGPAVFSGSDPAPEVV